MNVLFKTTLRVMHLSRLVVVGVGRYMLYVLSVLFLHPLDRPRVTRSLSPRQRRNIEISLAERRWRR